MLRLALAAAAAANMLPWKPEAARTLEDGRDWDKVLVLMRGCVSLDSKMITVRVKVYFRFVIHSS